MEQRTVIAAFSDSKTAQAVVTELERFGLGRGHINVHSNASEDGGTTASTNHEGGFSGWVKSLFGTEDETDYHRAYNSGNTVVSVDADDSQIDGVVDIIDRYNPVDLQEKSASASAGGTRGAVSNAPAMANAPAKPNAAAMATGLAGAGGRSKQGESSAVPVIEEDITIGKREVQRGGVRVVTRQIEKPVEKTVQLRDEKVSVDRQAVNRAATAADLDPKASQVIEMAEFSEEPVIEKRARVVEEVRVGKTVSERTETIRDNVRSTQVDVEQLGKTGATSGRTGVMESGDYRRDFQEKYGTGDEAYQTYGPAYEYGYTTASDPKYRNRPFSEVEPELRSSYEKKYPNSTWEKMKDAVQHGWNRVTGKA